MENHIPIYGRKHFSDAEATVQNTRKELEEQSEKTWLLFLAPRKS